MAYVRKRGKQLAIVHGQRDPDTKKVEQVILFTLFSKGEALEVLGKRGDGHGVERFRHLLERRHPDIRFDWPKITQGVKDNLEGLPDLYDYRETRLRGGFRPALREFAKALIKADPQWLISSAELVAEHRHELEFLKDLIDWRLATCDKQKRSKYNADNPFYWLYTLQGTEVPPEAEEMATELYKRRELDKAEAVFRMYVEAFHPYAEGHNYLGLIALERRDHERAVAEFEKTIELGRRQFPKRLAKKHYWVDLATRPYVRGLRNLALTYNYMGRYDDALVICDQLEDECGDVDTADTFRADISMNTGMWKQAAAKATRLRLIWPEHSLVAAMALVEMGKEDEAAPFFLHGVLNSPRAAGIVAGIKDPAPKSYVEANDHNNGIDLLKNLQGYLAPRRRGVVRLHAFITSARVTKLIDKLEKASRRWFDERSGNRADYDIIDEMKSWEYAQAKAGATLAQ